jgi:hypothetical protein
MISLAQEGELWDAISWGEYGYTHDTNYDTGLRLEKAFKELV